MDDREKADEAYRQWFINQRARDEEIQHFERLWNLSSLIDQDDPEWCRW